MRLPQAGPRRGRWKGDELRPPLATLTSPAVKAVCLARARLLLFSDFRRGCCSCLKCVARAVAMVKLSKEAKQRLQQLFKGGQFAIRWGFIPLVIYLGQ